METITKGPSAVWKWLGPLIGSLLALSILANGVLFWRLGEKVKPVAQPEPALEPEAGKDLALEAELRLAKMMLGQWKGEILTIGPVGNEVLLRGRLAWDRDHQQGFVSLRGLDSDEFASYRIGLVNRQEEFVPFLEWVPEGRSELEHGFRVPERVLAVRGVEVYGITADGEAVRLAAGKPLWE